MDEMNGTQKIVNNNNDRCRRITVTIVIEETNTNNNESENDMSSGQNPYGGTLYYDCNE